MCLLQIMVKKSDRKNKGVGYRATVDYSTPIEVLLKIKRFRSVSPLINSNNFPLQRKGKERIVVRVITLETRPVIGDIAFDREMAYIEENGYAVVNVREFLTVLSQNRFRPSVPVFALDERLDYGSSLLAPWAKEHCRGGICVYLAEV